MKTMRYCHTLRTSNPSDNVEQEETHISFGRVQDGTHKVKSNWDGPYKTKRGFTM